MENLNEKNHPIQTAWLFEYLFYHSPVLIILVFVNIFSFVYLSFSEFKYMFLILFIISLLELTFISGDLTRKKNFLFSLEEQQATFHQGKDISFLSPNQDLVITYEQIHHVYKNQNLFEKYFGLTGITIQFTRPEGAKLEGFLDNYGVWSSHGMYGQEWLGFRGDKVHIPGLKTSNAEELVRFLSSKNQHITVALNPLRITI